MLWYILVSRFSEYKSYTEGAQCNIVNATNGINGTPELVAPMGPMFLEGSASFAELLGSLWIVFTVCIAFWRVLDCPDCSYYFLDWFTSSCLFVMLLVSFCIIFIVCICGTHTRFSGIRASRVARHEARATHEQNYRQHIGEAHGSPPRPPPKKKLPPKTFSRGSILSRVRGGVNPPLREGVKNYYIYNCKECPLNHLSPRGLVGYVVAWSLPVL